MFIAEGDVVFFVINFVVLSLALGYQSFTSFKYYLVIGYIKLATEFRYYVCHTRDEITIVKFFCLYKNKNVLMIVHIPVPP